MNQQTRKQAAAFLDRDGTINKDKGYFYRPDELEFEDGAIAAIRLLNQAGYRVLVISNQSGIALGHFDEGKVDTLHRWMAEELARHEAYVDGFYYCPHHPKLGIGSYNTVCECRKPAPGLLLKAANEWDIDLNRSYMIGDHNSDVEAGLAAGVTPIFVRTGHGDHEEVRVSPAIRKADNLYEAVTKYILTKSS